MQKVTALLIFSFLFSITAFTQNKSETKSKKEDLTEFILKHELELEGYDKPEELEIEIHEGTDRFDIMIKSEVTSGKLTIAIFNPVGERKGIFTIGSSLDAEIKEKAYGKISKSMQEPDPGIWRIKLDPKKAKGMVRIDLKTSYKD